MFSSSFYPSDILTLNSSFKTVSSIINNESSFKFKDLKSTNLQFLSSERNIRIPDQLKLNKNNFNLTTRNNNFESVMEPIVKNHLSPKLVNLYSSSSSN